MAIAMPVDVRAERADEIPFAEVFPILLYVILAIFTTGIVLLFTDTRYRYLETVRQVVAVALYPLQRAVQMPGEAVEYVSTYFSSQRALSADNTALKSQLLADAPAVQSYPLELLFTVTLLVLVPYLILRGPVNRIASRFVSGGGADAAGKDSGQQSKTKT